MSWGHRSSSPKLGAWSSKGALSGWEPMLPSWRPLWGSLAAAVSPSPLSPSMHVPQESLSKFLSYKHPSVDSGPTGIPSDLILLTAAKPRFLHEVPFRGSGGRKFWGTVIPHPWPLLGASLPWSSPPPPPGPDGRTPESVHCGSKPLVLVGQPGSENRTAAPSQLGGPPGPDIPPTNGRSPFQGRPPSPPWALGLGSRLCFFQTGDSTSPT